MESKVRWLFLVVILCIGGLGFLLLQDTEASFVGPKDEGAPSESGSSASDSAVNSSPANGPGPLESIPLPAPELPNPAQIEALRRESEIAAWRADQRKAVEGWADWASELVGSDAPASRRFDPNDPLFQQLPLFGALQLLDRNEWDVYEKWRQQRFAEVAGYPMSEGEWPEPFREDMKLLVEVSRAAVTVARRNRNIIGELRAMGGDAPPEFDTAAKDYIQRRFFQNGSLLCTEIESVIQKRHNIDLQKLNNIVK